MTAICANINCPNYDAEAERSGQCCSPECVTASLIVIDGGVYVRQTDGTAKLLTGEPRLATSACLVKCSYCGCPDAVGTHKEHKCPYCRSFISQNGRITPSMNEGKTWKPPNKLCVVCGVKPCRDKNDFCSRECYTLGQAPQPLTKSERLLGLHGELCNRARQIMVVKNHDYCAGQPDLDPFANFNVTEQVLSIDARLLLLARILDKIQRLRGFLHTGSLAVKDESVDNCIIDMINYSVLFAGMTEECKVQHDQSNPLVVL